jgi:ABC-type (unclassified) transport system, ATPase component
MGIEAKNLRKVYNSRAVVGGVSLKMEQGEVVGLLGPNGAGKTTSFYMIVGLVKPDEGQIFINGEEVTALPMHLRSLKGIGYLPQEASVFRKLTTWENLMGILEYSKLSKRGQKARAEALLDEMNIGHLRDRQGMSLSGGERRRVEIARSLALEPSFILLDEPFAGVDPIAVSDIQNNISYLKNRGIGVLITDHNVRETLAIVDRAYILNEGQILVEGDSTAVARSPIARKYYLGEHFSL